ncbi:MAG TPA: trypsin-like peptidase domain-containing protein [Xanthobacteraceae bacterium]|nr:trypsin-like peptidase domain-containing protein [Xanthobacteraceae bacterium]
MKRFFTAILLALALNAASCLHVKAGPPLALGGATGEVPTLAPLVKQVTPGVVNIAVKARIPQQHGPRRPAKGRKQPEQEIRSIGSGVVIDVHEGLIITNNHVLEDAQEITITLADGRQLLGQRIGGDPEVDIALVKVPAEGLTAIPFGDSDKLEIGDFVLAIGNPFQIGQSVTFGIVSGLRRSGLGLEEYEDFIQTDAGINPGNSGGALVNLRGELVGINAAAIFRADGQSVGISFAIPTNFARAVVDQLRKYGNVRRGRLGIGIEDLTPDLARKMAVPPTLSGAVVAKVDAGSPAEQAGLKVGDVITALDGTKVRNMADLRNRVALLRVGDEAEFTVFRNEQSLAIRATVGERGKEPRQK